ncbi:hypothetical protein PV783_34040 [Chitinophaga sp. CC14]|uniref:hypothetical protein n=1 Tax=Chitinophaga sp. CC14 TaxID=3029199 RepID=UPI003B7D63D5
MNLGTLHNPPSLTAELIDMAYGGINNPYWYELRDLLLQIGVIEIEAFTFETYLSITTARNQTVNKFSWSIPNLDIVQLAADHLGTRIVEMGAGSGYWAWLFSQMGREVIAFDKRPWDIRYHPVHYGTPDILTKYHDHSLFLCWPPALDPMATDCLHYYTGNKLAFIGYDTHLTGDDEFHEILKNDWTLLSCHINKDWLNLKDTLYLYIRK